MQVALDARMLGERLHGLGRYVYALASHLARVAPQDRFLLLGSSPWADRLAATYPNVTVVPAPVRPFALAEHFVLPHLLRRTRPDLFHATSAAIPLLRPVPYVITMPDLIPLFYGHQGRLRYHLYFRHYLPHALRQARAVLAFSAASRDDMVRHLDVPADRIHVVPLGVEDVFRPQPVDQEAARLFERYGVRAPYLLTAGNPRPHKNLPLAVRVFDRLMEAPAARDLSLVVLSAASPALSAAVAASPRRSEIVCVAHVAEEDLPALYRQAHVFFYPSLYEGFGLPVLEALACGAVVVSSQAASLAEVVGSAGLLVEVGDEAACAEAVAQACSDAALRDRLQHAGPQRAASFTWQACAERMLAVYRAAMVLDRS